MVTRQQRNTNTPLYTRTYVSRAGETPGVIRAAWLIAVVRDCTGHLAARGDGLQGIARQHR